VHLDRSVSWGQGVGSTVPPLPGWGAAGGCTGPVAPARGPTGAGRARGSTGQPAEKVQARGEVSKAWRLASEPGAGGVRALRRAGDSGWWGSNASAGLSPGLGSRELSSRASL